MTPSTADLPINGIQNAIIHEFTSMDWLAKYEYLIQLGKNHPPLEENLKTPEHLLPGCQSRVWLIARKENFSIRFLADSDSSITRGILALLLRIFNHQPPEAVTSADLYCLQEIGLSTHLSPARRNGLFEIIRQMKQMAAERV